jgi:predicted transcriptional regulator of viral defense system
MRSLDYFEAHPVFSHAEFLAVRTAKGRSPSTSNNLLAKHLAARRLIRVRRGLYAAVPRNIDPTRAAVDPYLIASHLSDDAVVAYHAALQFFGKSYSIWQRLHYLTGRRAKAFSFRKMEFIPVLRRTASGKRSEKDIGIIETNHNDGQVRIATLERTMVDVLDAPDKGGGWEEIWRSLEMIEFFDIDIILRYTRALGSALTAARVGFYLEQHSDSLMLEDKHLKPFEKLSPAQPAYLDSARRPGKLVKRWNLIVPDYVLKRRWEEMAG